LGGRALIAFGAELGGDVRDVYLKGVCIGGKKCIGKIPCFMFSFSAPSRLLVCRHRRDRAFSFSDRKEEKIYFCSTHKNS